MQPSRSFRGHVAAALLVSCALAACDRDPTPADSAGPSLSSEAAAPPSLVSLPADAGALAIWPYTGADFSGTPQDPINLVFTGRADPRAIRAALFTLSGDRTAFGFPPVAPFTCTWTDAIGDLQTGYGAERGWVGSAVQLSCGVFGPVRFHVRLFQAGPLTLGNAHFELLIPGTTDHQVLSWELAEQLVAADLARTGLLAAAPAPTVQINGAPTFREIPPTIYNLLPPELRALIGGPPAQVSGPVGIATDGRATRFALGGSAPAAVGTTQRFVIDFDQIIPRPFCTASAAEYLHAQGPVELSKEVRVNPSGALVSEFHASGRLRLTPVDPATGAPVGEPYEAEVSDHQITRYDDGGGQVEGTAMQRELPQNVAGRGRKTVRLKVGPGDITQYDQDIACHP
jgi:hypothetical protein